jgi:hypothetical protein
MFEAIVILASATLYRIPRGGPDTATWLRWTSGRFDGSSFIGSAIWALATAAMLAGLFQTWWLIALAPLLMIAEAPSWSDYWPNNDERFKSYWLRLGLLTLRGCLLFNPLMGVIYFGLYAVRQRLPRRGEFLDGWTAYGELLSGAVTAAALVGICHAFL